MTQLGTPVCPCGALAAVKVLPLGWVCGTCEPFAIELLGSHPPAQVAEILEATI